MGGLARVNITDAETITSPQASRGVDQSPLELDICCRDQSRCAEGDRTSSKPPPVLALTLRDRGALPLGGQVPAAGMAAASIATEPPDDEDPGDDDATQVRGGKTVCRRVVCEAQAREHPHLLTGVV